jgi:hypothetical protein
MLTKRTKHELIIKLVTRMLTRRTKYELIIKTNYIGVD